MNNEERELINQFFNRVGSGGASARPGSVPSSTNLPPIDPEADQFIHENFKKYPEAAYRVTQMAVVQEAALVEAQNRIRQLEWEVHQARQQMQQLQTQRPQQQNSSGGFFSNLFGNNRQQPQQPQQNMPPGWGGAPNNPSFQGQPQNNPYGNNRYAPPPQMGYPTGYQQGMFNRGGNGFLGGALATAAGVAGGMMMGNALTGLFSGGHHVMGDVTGAATGAGASDPFSDPFAGSGAAVDPNFDA
ncbi:MAG: DUF2076 domain-containing protein, partial [Commensalibacter sp.]|nr:DUF2076 domain-containing protein [Commensalibacter sp.]